MLKEVVKEYFMMEKEKKEKYGRRNETNQKRKRLHGDFLKSILDFAASVLWQWLKSEYVKKNTGAAITAARD